MADKNPRFQWLTSWGTFIAAMAATAGLAVGAVASLSAWQAVQAQNSKDQRAQASLVTIWEEKRSDGQGMLHLSNRSLDPIETWILVLYSFPETEKEKKRSYSSSLPPCTEIILNPATLPNRRTDKPDILTFTYVDSSGLWWRRGSWGKLDQTENISEGESGAELPFDKVESLGGKVQTIEQCGNK
jgi:hypothetical protein